MLNLKNKLAKRILAFALSGAMVVSGMSTSAMTAFAAEASTEAYSMESTEDTNTHLEEEAAEEQQGDGAKVDINDTGAGETDKEETLDKEDTDKESDKNVSDKEDSDNEAALDKETLEAEASKEEDAKDSESSAGDAEDEMTASADAEEVQDTDIDNKASTHTVWMVGDSTMCSYPESELVKYYPRYGYGTQFQTYLDNTYTVNNLAMSGRSSKSFLTETNYTTLKNGIQSGDILIIGWGHNDENTGEATYTAPNGTSTTKDSFAKSLYDNYIKLANDKGAQPILCTPIVRRDSSGNYTGDKIHQANGGDYKQDIINLGEEVNVPVVDLTTLTKNLYVELGVEGTLYLHAWSGEESNTVDNTHLNIYGAKKVAYMLAKAIKEEHSDLDIAEHITLGNEPTKDADLVVSDKYVKLEYAPPTSTSKIWEKYGIFSGSVFGDTGTNPSTTAFTIGRNEEGNMFLKASGYGKLSGTNNGIVMYYYQIPSDAKISFSAKAHIEEIKDGVSNPGQAGFGLMARDNMYIDTKDANIKGDYVVAGTLMDGSANCFYNQGNSLKKGKFADTDTVSAPAVGDEYELSIRTTVNGFYACKFGDYEEQVGGFDFPLNTIDNKYQYIGMFVARNAGVSFSDIELIVDGYRIDIMTGDRTPVDEGSEPKPGQSDEGGESKPAQSDEGNEPKPGQSDEGNEPKPGQSDEGSEPKPVQSDEGNEPKPSQSDEGGESKPDQSNDGSGSNTGNQNKGDTDDSKITAYKNQDTVSISGSKIKIEAANLILNPKKVQYNVTVTYTYKDEKGKEHQQQLTEGLHYKVAFVGNSDGKTEGEQKINIIGTGTSDNSVTDLGKFVNKKTVSYQLINKSSADKTKDISKVKTITLDKNATKNLSYTGDYIIVEPTISGVDAKNANGKANYAYVYKNNVNAGKASVTVIGQGDYYGSKVLTYTIKPTDLSKAEGLTLSATNATISGSGKAYSVATPFTYKGSPVMLEGLTLTYAGKDLRPKQDYTVAYKVNVQKGTGTATIKGINNFKGSIKIDYKMEIDSNVATKLGTLNTSTNAVPAEFSSKGARLTEIALENGITLKENVDYKVTYGSDCKTATVGQEGLTVTIAGAGAYKSAISKGTTIAIKVERGKYHIKDGTVVDTKKATTDAKLISAAKIMDASGAKVKDVTLAAREAGKAVDTIKVIPSDSANYEETELSCHVASKLGSVKQTAIIPNQAFDGVNSVTVTKKSIADALGLTEKDFNIVSYKNNNKLGSATVTIEGTGLYYGTKNLKFKIVSDKINPDDAASGETEETKVIEDPSEEDSSDKSSSSGAGSGPDESTPDENLPDESTPDESTPDENLPDDPTPSGKRIDVWDFGGYEETDTNTYNNNITPDLLKPLLSQGGTLGEKGDEDAAGYKKGWYNVAGPAKFGDLAMYYELKDRIYTNVSALSDYSAGTSAQAQNKYDETYTSAGAWYGNGSRTDKKGYIQIDNVQAGDKIIAYMGNHNSSGDITFMFAGQGNASAQTVEAPIIGRTFDKFTFVAEHTGTYKIYQGAGSGKPMYHRVMRVPSVTVSGTINLNGNDISGYGLRFINQTDKTLPDVMATVKTDGTFTAQLSAGYTYRALLTGAVGYGIVASNNSDKVTTTDADAITGKTGLVFTVETQETYTYSGTIEGFAEDYDVSKLAITMEPTPDFDTNPVDLTIDTTAMTFSAKLEPNVRYTFALEGVNDYEIKSPDDVCKEDQSSNFTGKVITVALKPMYNVIGGFIGLGDDVTVEKLIFENVADKYEYEATVAIGGYSISLRDGEYLAKATVSDTTYSTTTHVVVDGGMVSQDLLFVSSASKEDIAYVGDIYVGYPKQANNYATVSEAVEAASRMKVEKENEQGEKTKLDRTEKERVTIHIAPGTYREQIIVNTPYISFVNDTNEEVLLTWYYGIGYVYYSAGTNGFYDAQNAYDKYAKRGVARWGTSVNIQNKASGFRAEGITFENSFNRYITDEELADGAEPAVKYTTDQIYSDTSIAVERNYSVDVKSRAATERAAAVVIEKEANNLEFYNCKFYSSQDTLYTSGGPIYFKNCVIEGQTDYIYGSGSCVFDACELSWKGYSVGGQGGYITANSPRTTGTGNDKVRAEDDLGYLFRNCTVTANTGLPVAAGYFGRPWGQQARVIFMNTKLQNKDMIAAAGWTAMSGVDPTKVHVDFCEYKTTSLDGTTVNTTGRTNAQMTDAEATAIKVKDYFGKSWTPKHYTEDATGDVTFSADPSLTDNGDINVPNPGHTLTVNYALSGDDAKNDVSTIKWYIVEDENGKNPVLEKVSTAAVDKTYKITKAASKKYIMVEVTPETLDGRTGGAKSFILKKEIGSDYVDPSSGSDITVGDGINVYLAGDSTVKDYSAKGMWNGGKQSEDLGSWGEYIQSFFDESEVTVQNFAQGGRSVRSFMNEDVGDEKNRKYCVIEENIGEGDYLFIQFGHNDSSVSSSKADVYTPIGTKVNGKYPYTKGTKNSEGKYPDYYTWKDGAVKWIDDGSQGTGTYCWFLQQYVDMALAKGAIPVIMSPVARMQYDSSSKTNKTHHKDDGSDTNNPSYYWEAAKQVYEDNKAKGNNVLFIDAYGLTTELFNGAYKDGEEARGKEIMSISDGTHNNKLGGMVEAMLVAEAIQGLDTPLSYAVKTPSQVSGVTTTEKTVFSIDSSSNFTAYEQKFTGTKETAAYTADTFTAKSVYWSNYGNTKLANISKKAGELADSNVSDSVVAAPKATSEMSDVDGKTIVTVTLSSATSGATIYYTDDGVTNPKASDGKTAVTDAKEYNATNKIVLDKDTTIKAFAMADGKTASKVVTFTFSVKPDVQPPTADKETGSTITAGTVIHLEAMDGAEIRYTMGNGSKVSDPTANSSLYNKETGLTITSSTTIKAIAIKNGVKSDVATFEFVVNKEQLALNSLSSVINDVVQAMQTA